MTTKKTKSVAGAAEKTASKTVKKAKPPKRIAGVKVTKKMRGAGAALLDGINSPMGREVIGAGLAMIAAAAASRTKTGADAADAVGKGAAKAAKGAARAGDAAAEDASQIVDAITAAATAVIKSVIDSRTKAKPTKA